MDRIKDFMFSFMAAACFFMLGCICILLGVVALGFATMLFKQIGVF